MPISIQAITGGSPNYGLRPDNGPVNAVEPVERFKNPNENEGTGVAIGKRATTDLFAASQDRTSKDMGGPSDLSEVEKKEVAELKSIDREVRAHKMAHMTAGGNLVTKGASFDYKTGPDGQRYAVSGEVGIDTSEVRGDPGATIRKMAQVVRAALAPANPSSQDSSVAAQASSTSAQAQQELARQRYEEAIGNQGEPATSSIRVSA
ncbi:MAG: hypothetical protein MUO76_18150 [Anaerolineaceae bacterium]|nr:hypothetical protein [Anaerolineaceae bacterium]